MDNQENGIPDNNIQEIDKNTISEDTIRAYFVGTFDKIDASMGKDYGGQKIEDILEIKIDKINFDDSDYVHKRNRYLASKDITKKKITNTHHVINEDINELLLFHGTKNRFFESIKTNGFDQRLASNGLFGEGLYFAEDSAKSHHYTDTDSYGYCYMIICKVLMGKNPYFTKIGCNFKREPCVEIGCRLDTCAHSERHTSLVAETGETIKRFREFVVYKGDYVLPLYLIKYKLRYKKHVYQNPTYNRIPLVANKAIKTPKKSKKSKSPKWKSKKSKSGSKKKSRSKKKSGSKKKSRSKKKSGSDSGCLIS